MHECLRGKKKKKKTVSILEKKMVEIGITRILTGIRHSQTNGSLKRLHGKIRRKLLRFETIMMHKSDPVYLFAEQYNRRRSYMSLGISGGNEILTHVFVRKMPPREETSIDKQAGDKCHVK